MLRCEQSGITLIVVPFWWDKSMESLVGTIASARPDIIMNRKAGDVIPMEMPPQLPQKGTQHFQLITLILAIGQNQGNQLKMLRTLFLPRIEKYHPKKGESLPTNIFHHLVIS